MAHHGHHVMPLLVSGEHPPVPEAEPVPGPLAYFWPNATYVHCEGTPCAPYVFDARVFEHKLPKHLYLDHVDADGKITIPCGRAVTCARPSPAGPYGPLSLNHSQEVAVTLEHGTNYSVGWHPVMYHECRSPGVYAHAMLMVIAAVVLLPTAFAALARGGKGADGRARRNPGVPHLSLQKILDPKKIVVWAHLLGIALSLLSAITISIIQARLGSLPECQHTGAGER